MALTKEQAERAVAKLTGGRRDSKRSLLTFVEWAGDRARELETHAQGEIRDFLVALADDADSILGRADAGKEGP